MNPHQFTYTTNLPDMPVTDPLPPPPVRPEGIDELPDSEFIFAGPGESFVNPDGSFKGMVYDTQFKKPGWVYGTWAGNLEFAYYAFHRGSPIHRAQPWFHESQVVAGEPSEEEMIRLAEQRFKERNTTAPTYPPDESEWPEKPDAGEGMVWERVSDAGVFEDGDIIYDACNRVWDRGESGQRYERSIVFTRVPAPQWRELGPEDKDEVITEDHEVRRGDGDQFVIPRESVGKTFGECLSRESNYRARTRRPLPPSDYVDPVSGVTVPEEIEIPHGFPRPVIPKGKRGVNRGFGYMTTDKDRTFITAGFGAGEWFGPFTNATNGMPDLFFIELVDEAPTAERKASGVEARVCGDIADRQAIGIAKYGTTVEANPLPYREWLNHHYQELLDAAVYVKKQMEVLDGIGGDQ